MENRALGRIGTFLFILNVCIQYTDIQIFLLYFLVFANRVRLVRYTCFQEVEGKLPLRHGKSV